MNIRAMIAEDERLVREELAYLIQQEEDFILCPSAENGEQLLELFHQYKPDVIFLDIHMPSLSGIEVAKTLAFQKNENDTDIPLLVFSTAYDEYAIQAFDLEAVDYLLKPYDIQRFKATIERVRKKLGYRSGPLMKAEDGDSISKETTPNSLSSNRHAKLLIDDGEKVIVLSPQSIQYAVKQERWIEIHTDQGTIQAKMTLQELEEKVKHYPFFRPHRSYLVNLDYIYEITPWFNGAYNALLKNKEKTKIPVSRTSAKALFKILEQ
ncbi:LytTR family DNA-binding domain-containing protein [Fodinisporobacter ferrooxydans]|uniref:LytTR family DNA-binding domain-containing protein n=1 Tax=Fodinisporobacter ferrooxydans TaxID=2901836 RepID=A0ABY4CHI8_9BACL|nr:LytTR family DNA-binding domain-containing protein [Alicyclobacillaceae bacterium MYW30-H2]